jgi:tripeptide aminopeptidase
MTDLPIDALADEAAERLMRYARIDTQSDKHSTAFPSTEKQFDLLRLLRDELQGLGIEDVDLDDHGYLFGTVPATVTHAAPTIGFLAHVDTTPDVSGTNVQPQRIRYHGGEIVLPGDTRQVISPDESPELRDHVGHDLITSDGTTLLGADDKAGVAEIMTAVAYLRAHPDLPHGPLRVGFNPDEELGTGTDHFDIERFGAEAAYTLDGSTAGELHDETFSAARFIVTIHGRAVHPGWGKDKLVNALRLAGEIATRLPRDLSPETTEGREGFIHLDEINGDAAVVELRIILRDHDDALLDQHVALLRQILGDVAATEPRATIEHTEEIQYRNMRNELSKRPEIVERAEEAIRRVGLEPKRTLIRGGTDGSRLTEKGLPTPNLFTGGQLYHSEREWCCVRDMGLAVATIVELAVLWAE